ncbi:hypothetical protein [Nocardioides sp. GY 10127]|uniref:hypothetical protein n=1 Tax=Nocardioides sp. GY 10127 TaxID=2569762 RepID=UPI0010A8DD3E|nr:hypothetical protein [Nocardioides sp. GY 10127]TIC81605.1 hypothetical protein E8D37_10355 [Nocardioides sp. GY 10127]
MTELLEPARSCAEAPVRRVERDGWTYIVRATPARPLSGARMLPDGSVYTSALASSLEAAAQVSPWSEHHGWTVTVFRQHSGEAGAARNLLHRELLEPGDDPTARVAALTEGLALGLALRPAPGVPAA